MVILKELCGSKLRLVAVTAGKLRLRMRFELWCLPSLVEGPFINILFWGGGFHTACCLIVIETPKHRHSLNIATGHGAWLSYVRFEVLTVVGVRDACLLGCGAAYFRKEQAAAILVLRDGCFKMAVAGSSDMPVPICQTARQ